MAFLVTRRGPASAPPLGCGTASATGAAIGTVTSKVIGAILAGIVTLGSGPAVQASTANQDAPNAPIRASLVTAGGDHFTCAGADDGTLRCWGRGANGQLGVGQGTTQRRATLVPGITGMTALDAGNSHVCAVANPSDSLYCWGANGHGQLGLGHQTTQLAPVRVPGISGVRAVSASARHTCAILSDRAVSCWGDNSDGQLGRSEPAFDPTPTRVPGVGGAIALSIGTRHTCALTRDDTEGTTAVRCWGVNSLGELGLGDRNPRAGALAIPDLSGIREIASTGNQTCALTSDRVLCWGAMMGDAPTAVDSSRGIDWIRGGTVFTGGRNGQLVNWTSPVAPQPLTDLRNVVDAASSTHYCAIDEPGNLYCWGNNLWGQLGQGDDVRRDEPTMVLPFGVTAPQPTETSLAGPASSVPPAEVEFTITVRAGDTPADGTVELFHTGQDGAEQSRRATLNAQGRATIRTRVPPGETVFRARYPGTLRFQPSVSAPLTHVSRPVQAETTTSVSGPARSAQGESVTFSATVQSFFGTPSGMVSFRRDGTQFGTGRLNDAGRAQVSVNTLPQGTHRITAHFLGTAEWEPSASRAITHVVEEPAGDAETMTLLSGPERAVVGTPVTLHARVIVAQGGLAGGTVSFHRNGTRFATATLDDQGAASVTTTRLPQGTHGIIARYGGAEGFQPSASDTLLLSITNLQPDFSGGGAVFGLTDACGPVLGTGPQAVTVHYSPSELGGLPSGVSVVWPEGSEHLALWGAMAPSGDDFFGGAGRQSWTRFVFYPTRPLIRVVRRIVTQPAGAGLAEAQELFLRLRVQNFAAIPGCSVTLTATLGRGG